MTLAVIERSHPQFCAVCQGEGDVLMAPVDAPELMARIRCLHCGPLHRPYVLNLSTTNREKTDP